MMAKKGEGGRCLVLQGSSTDKLTVCNRSENEINSKVTRDKFMKKS